VSPVVADVLYTALGLFSLLLFGRVIASWVFMFRRTSRASGPAAMLLELIYTVTDPPVKALQRVLPPFRLGNFLLDVAVIVLFLVVNILMGVVGRYR
jgi:YggT family protein